MITRAEVEKPSIPVYNGEEPRIESSLIIPNATHGFAIGVEYVRDWFLKLFGDTVTTPESKRFFKTIWINGSHVMDNYKSYSYLSQIKKQKPMVAFTPVPDMQYDRDLLDQYRGSREMYIRKFNHTGSFFKDYKNNIFLGMNVRDLRINFNIKCRVETLAQQLNLYRQIEAYAGVGRTHYEWISGDFHIPKEIMINIAKHAGFKFEIAKGNLIIEDQVNFLKYLNSNSQFLITYKLMSMNGHNEYFMRIPRLWVHMDKQDKLDINDGERQGQTTTNYDIDWNVVLTIKVPSFYVYGSAQAVYEDIPLQEDSNNMIGIWTCKVLDIPPQNHKGWNLLFSTVYDYDDDEIDENIAKIDLSSFFRDRLLKTMIESHIELNMSPERFLSIAVFNFNDDAKCDMDWNKEILTVSNNNDHKVVLACYMDSDYIHEKEAQMSKANNTRLS